MTLVRPKELPIGPYPFEHDKLDRQGRVTALCNLIQTIESPAVIAVNGRFGSGKSVFLEMCAAQLRNAGQEVVEFNAWTQSHTGLPLVDLVSALAKDETAFKRLLEIAINVGLRAAGILSKGFFSREDFEKSMDLSKFGDWQHTEAQVNGFKKELEKLAKQREGLVVVVDELDRCLPEQAMAYLNVVRHLFDVDRVVIVLGVNELELRERVRKLYGQDCDAEVYLRRFVDLIVDLPDPGPRLGHFLDWVYESAGLGDRLKADEDQHAGRMVRLLAERSGMSLRDIEQTVHQAACVLEAVPAPVGSSDDVQSAKEEATLSLHALRAVAPDVYSGFVAGTEDRFAAAECLVRELSLASVARHPGDGDAGDGGHETGMGAAAVRMVAALLALHSDLGGQELRTGLAGAEWGGPAFATAIEQEVVRVRPSFTVITVGEIADLVELAVWSG
ncbi:MAG: AAA family ATPase [Acidimicrobiaceae bacterium]|nr:P-loop NTPase fold protein [Acidimicrobiaceae bacterium]MCY3650593.1 P-loop NTPase fold protein [Acidimicrobiaceae bacterium]MDE0515177.1 P-loop NTPase fold protein [Acidimicrobiaceae bacterium]MDE0657981.1 P-loop NTPase fold protein [Acidimicrobiaceae bacterium]MXZ64702.1 AAA family ATPase [Acidimicrobiaceae bacterium]